MLGDADVSAYFARTGYAGEPTPDRATLAELVLRHTLAIPFENFDPLLGRPVRLEPDALIAKLVHGRRGGYCFEQNGLFWRVLEAIGFRVTPLAARVLWNMDEDAVTPRSHMLLRVDLPERPVIVDVGFGGAVLTGVLDLVTDVEQETPHEPFRLIEHGGEWRLQILIGDDWRTCYRFDLHPQLAIDFEPVNWWVSTSPASHFTQGVTCARVLPEGRLAVRSGLFTRYGRDGSFERREVDEPEAFCDILSEEMGLELPDRAALIARLGVMAA
ncbi:MAG: arylamine N-acetyltransferase [Sphingomonas sp.]|uniref:arylamine N-acetyltransferase family protein n=1 Tax=Sphingomonas sp. TaxID=28214 RepID=UPI001B24D33E|nr:arylamine N-acetyltransferase [Sphingomonas sp.]MBO9621615.1 arylamine N-acetyltransferase [Sphingomonas sp.]